MAETTEGAGEAAAEVISLNDMLKPVLIAAIAETIVSILTTLSAFERMLAIVVLGLAYGMATGRMRVSKSVAISRRATIVITALLIFSILLVILASLMLNLSMAQILALLVLLVLMIVALLLARSLPDTSVALKPLIANVAAFSLGAALVIGGAPVVSFASAAGTADLTIENNCANPILYADMNVNVPAFGSQVIAVPAVSFIIERGEANVTARALSTQSFEVPLTGGREISVDGIRLSPGDSVRLDLLDGGPHTIRVDCPV